MTNELHFGFRNSARRKKEFSKIPEKLKKNMQGKKVDEFFISP
jgi:hypothetical protein